MIRLLRAECRLLLVPAVALVLACRADPPPAPVEAVDQDPPAEVEVSEPQPLPEAEATTEAGHFAGLRADPEPSGQPASLPEDIPLYPGTALDGEPWSGNGGVKASFSTEDPPQTAYGIYRDSLLAEGWEIEGEQALAGGRLVTLQKGARRMVFLMRPFEDGTEIRVSALNAQ